MMLNNRIRVLRARFRFTQQALALKVGVTRQTIAAVEKGEYVPSLLLAMKICREFDMVMEEVFQLQEESE
ncbi:helix-turn-helix transcriptional regulator [Staphylococcus sp. SIMBA_130]